MFVKPQGPREVLLPSRSHPKGLPKGACGPSPGTPLFSSLLFWSSHVACVSSLAHSALAGGAHITLVLVAWYPRGGPLTPHIRWQSGRELISWHRSHFPGLGDVHSHSTGQPGGPRPFSLLAFQQTVIGEISKGVCRCNTPSGSLTGVGGPGPGGSAQTREHVPGRGTTAEPFGWVFSGKATAVLCRICLARSPAHRQNGYMGHGGYWLLPFAW